VNAKHSVGGTIKELAAAFPAAFALDPTLVRPLKLGIRDDLYAQSDISHRRIAAALRSYCNSVNYLAAHTEGAERVDLAGKPAGIVTAAEAEHARLAGRLPNSAAPTPPRTASLFRPFATVVG
jgi:ProP effector